MPDFLSPAVDPYVRFVEACARDFLLTSREQNWSIRDTRAVAQGYAHWLELATARASAS